MNTNFQQVFNVTILHSYFEGGICNCLEFMPTAATADLMHRYRFTMDEKVNGFALYTTSVVPLRDSLTYIQAASGDDRFEFELLNNNPAFYCFTALPMNWVGQLLYDSAQVTVSPEGTLVLQEILSSPETTFIAGKMSIRFSDLLDRAMRGQPAAFEISYTARATQWRYYVVNRNAVPMENAMVKGRNSITFTNGGKVKTAAGEEAVVYSSDSLIPLSRNPKYIFDLVNQPLPAENKGTSANSSPRIIFKGLPNPDPAMMAEAEINNKIQVSSPIYIYV